MVAGGGSLAMRRPGRSSITSPAGLSDRHSEARRAGLCALAVCALVAAMVAVGAGNDGAIELLASHHAAQIRTGLEAAMTIESASAHKDSSRLQELDRLAAAADLQAKNAKSLRNTEQKKLDVSPSSKVDAESMLASEAGKKAADLKRDVKSIHAQLHDLAKKLRKEHHAARQKQRLLTKVQHETRDGEIALHDREMKVLEARHDVENAAKAGDVSVLRDAQARLKQRKQIAEGARAQEEENKKMRDQIAARARLLHKRAQMTLKLMQSDKARAHNLVLLEREEKEASKAIGARANLLRDTAALKAARAKYSSLAELLGDANSDHSEVEATLSKIASNIHTWKDLRRADEKDVEKRAKAYQDARKVVTARSISLSRPKRSAMKGQPLELSSGSMGGEEDLLQVREGAGYSWWSQRPVELMQELQSLQQQGQPMYAYVPEGQAPMQQPQMAYVPQQQATSGMMTTSGAGQVPQQALSPVEQPPQRPQQMQQVPAQYAVQPQQQQMSTAQAQANQEQQNFVGQGAEMTQQQQQQQVMAQQGMAQQARQPQAPRNAQALQSAVAQTGAATQAPPAGPAVLPGAVGDVPYVYNDKQYLPSRCATDGYPIVWIFADNKTPDPLYFGFQSADGTMHVYNEVKPNSVTRQQAFGNEFWTLLAGDKKTVAVQPFKVTQNNQWISIQPSGV